MVTLNPDTDDAISAIATDADRVIRLVMDLKPGEAVQIRRADYLDTKAVEDVVFEPPKLTLLQGGRNGV